MKVVYICHAISGDVQGNLEKIKNIVREINLTEEDVVPFAPYWLDCHALDDSIPEERERGIKNDHELFNRGFIDELWLYGDKISAGMWAEIRLAQSKKIKVVCKTPETHRDQLTATLKLITDKCPEAVIGGSVALHSLGLLERFPKDIDIFFPESTSLTKIKFFSIEGITDLTSDTVTDTNGKEVQRTGVLVNGLKCCAFKVPQAELQHSIADFYGLKIKIQHANFAIAAKRAYVDKNGKHKEDLIKIQETIDSLPF
jgi:hypothetical protein